MKTLMIPALKNNLSGVLGQQPGNMDAPNFQMKPGDSLGSQQSLCFTVLQVACSALPVYVDNIRSPQVSDGVNSQS